MILEYIGTLLGLIYLWLEYRANAWLWVVGIIMPAVYIVVYYQAGLYADFGINIYYVLAGLYGLWAWQFGQKENKELPITRCPLNRFAALSLAFIVLLAAIYVVLVKFTDSNVPLADSFTTALSIVGMYMLARKYVEQWLAWIAVDAVCTVLYIYKELYATSALYALYTLIAIVGYRKWKQML